MSDAQHTYAAAQIENEKDMSHAITELLTLAAALESRGQGWARKEIQEQSAAITRIWRREHPAPQKADY